MRVLRYVRLGVGAGLALCVCATAAIGQQLPPPPSSSSSMYPPCPKTKSSPEDIEAAKGAHTTAGSFYERGEYDNAIAQWLIAYNKFDCTAHGLLLNIANAQEKKGDKAGALVTLDTYLERAGKNAAPNVKERRDNLFAALQAAPTAQPTAPPPPTALPTAPTAAPTVAPTAAPTTGPDNPPPGGSRPYGVYPWVTVAVGGALAVAGAILLPVGQSAISSATKGCSGGSAHTGCTMAAVTQGNTGRTEVGAGWGVLSVGVAAVAGGLVWQLLYNKPQPPKAAPPPGASPPRATGLELVPLLGPGQGGVGVAGRF